METKKKIKQRDTNASRHRKHPAEKPATASGSKSAGGSRQGNAGMDSDEGARR